jgi:hypothetical protein
MVESILTKEMIDIGKALIEKLDERNLSPEAAFWLYEPETQQWKLVIAESRMGTLGPKEIYRRIQQILSEPKNKITGISLDDVALHKPNAPIIVLLRVAIQTGPGISGIRFKNNVINGTLIEDAYIYRIN